MDISNLFVHNDIDICIKNIDKNYIYYHNEPCNPNITITKSVYIYFPPLSDSNLGVLIFVKDINNNFKQYFFDKTTLFTSLNNEIIYSHQIIACKSSDKYINIIQLSVIDSNNIKYNCFINNQNIHLLINGASKITIEQINNNKYCLEYELEIDDKKNIKLYCTKRELKLLEHDNYIGKLKLVERIGDQDYLYESNDIQNNITDDKIINGNMGICLLLICVIIMIFVILINKL